MATATQRIRALNDELRTSMHHTAVRLACRELVITRGIAAHGDDLAVRQLGVRGPAGMHDIPQHPVRRVEAHRRTEGVRQFYRRIDVVIVPVGGNDRQTASVAHRINDRPVIVGGIHHHDLVMIAHDPDVVLDVEIGAVERKKP